MNSGASESYSYAGDMRISRNNIWTESRDCVVNEMSYYLYDGRGSVTANTWYNGMVTNVYQYDPYGQVTLGSTEHRDFYGYNGESYNPNSGLEYLRARYYNADKGRFIQEDSYLGDVTEPLTLNRYAYVKNSPLNYVDPSGHEASPDLDNIPDGVGTDYQSAQPTAADTDRQETQAVKHPRTTMLKALLNKAWEITGDAVSYCENYIAGVDAQIYEMDTRLYNLLWDKLNSNMSVSQETINAYILGKQYDIAEFDYVAYHTGYVDGGIYWAM